MGALGSKTLAPHLQGWVDKFHLSTFVETGLGQGGSLAVATKLSGLTRFISIEINKERIEKVEQIGLENPGEENIPLNDSITLLHGSSVDKLSEALLQIEGGALWWLDAHIPPKLGQTPIQCQPHLDFPLEDELGIITSGRDIRMDVILCDDIRMYDNKSRKRWFQERGYEPKPNDSRFVEAILNPTHTITRIQKNSGYIVAVPKDV